MSNDAPIIDAELANFLVSGTSINLGSSGAHLRPSVARALGARVADDRRSVRLLLSCHQSAALIEHVRQSGRVAAVFSQPTTHRTVQLKGDDARIEPQIDLDLATVRRYRHDFVRELGAIGYRAEVIYSFLHCPDADILALVFTPSSAFVSTPGPKAGQVLKGGA